MPATKKRSTSKAPPRRKGSTAHKPAAPAKRERSGANIRVGDVAHAALLSIRDELRKAGHDVDLSGAIAHLSTLHRTLAGVPDAAVVAANPLAGVVLDDTLPRVFTRTDAAVVAKPMTERALVDAAIVKSGMTPAAFGRVALLDLATRTLAEDARRRSAVKRARAAGDETALARVAGTADARYERAYKALKRKGVERVTAYALCKEDGTTSYRTAQKFLDRRHPEEILGNGAPAAGGAGPMTTGVAQRDVSSDVAPGEVEPEVFSHAE